MIKMASKTIQTCPRPRNFRKSYTQTSVMPAPMRIDNGPIQVKDEPYLVQIIIGGSEMYVSPWSVKDGIYHPGLDSEFLVHRFSMSKKKH